MATSFSGWRSQSTRREPPTMGKQLVNLRLQVRCTFFCNLQSQAWTHAILVIGLYELLGNPTTVHSKCINDHTLRSDIFLPKCPTHSREISVKFESRHSPSPIIWSDIVVGRESGYLKIFFTFLEVNMSNILWSMRICKHTFFSVCRMSRYVNTLVYFYHAPYFHQER